MAEEFIAEELIRFGADVNSVCRKGKTPLFHATRNNNREIVEILIRNGADVNATDPWGDTALMEAVKRGHMEIVEILIRAGADPEMKRMKKHGEILPEILLECVYMTVVKVDNENSIA